MPSARATIAEIAPDDNVLSALYARVDAEPDAAALLVCESDAVTEITVRELVDRVRAVAGGLVRAGVEPGDRVVIFGRASVEWTVADYAIWQAGAVGVTIYETSSPEQVAWIIENSGAVLAFVENAEFAAIIERTRAEAPDLADVVVLGGGGLDAFAAAGEIDGDELDRRAATLSLDAPATLVYTSGTTGRSKGCVLTHRNLIWTIRQVILTEPLLTAPGNRTLTFLPLAHVLARVVQLTAVTAGVPVAFGGGIRTLVDDLAVVQPTWLTVVPRVLEKVRDGAAQKAGSGFKRRVFDRAEQVARAVGAHRVANTPIPLRLQIEHAVADRLVYRAIRGAVGGRLAYVISGGAPLHADLARFFSGVGIEVLEGYGLTETTGPATVHRIGHSKPGTVGPPLDGVEARISAEGEILLTGGCVFKEYWDNEEATREAFVDGALRTGDFGEIDEDGHVVITGRLKDLIVTAGGKNIAPVPLETTIAQHPLISHAVVVGDDRPFIAALVTLDTEELEVWANARGRDVGTPDRLIAELATEPELIAELQTAIDAANEMVSRAEGIRSFRVLDAELTVEGGELTPTMKVKRAVVIANHADVVADIYEA